MTKSSSTASCWKEHATHPEFVAVILLLLATEDEDGGRDGLYPLTSSAAAAAGGDGDNTSSSSMSQQEVVGISLLDRLLTALAASGVVETVLAVSAEQQYRALRSQLLADGRYQVVSGGGGKKDDKDKATDKEPPLVLESTSSLSSSSSSSRMRLTVLRLTAAGDDEAAGSSSSLDALQQIEDAQIVPADSHLVVLPGDLVVLQAESLKQLMDRHRRGSGPQQQQQRWMMAVNPTPQQQQQHGDTAASARKSSPPPAACTVLLADVAEVDEHGNPLKESAKQKKGLLAREEEEIDYMAVTAADHRLVWKRPKLDVEEDKDMVGSTPKLVFPKARLRLRGSGSGVVRVSTEWNDVHCYCLAPWVRRLVTARLSTSGHSRRMQSIPEDLVPLLIARQFRGVAATFGSQVETEVVDEVLRTHPHLRRRHRGMTHPESNLPSLPLRSSNVAAVSAASGGHRPEAATSDDCHDDEYVVLAHIVSDKSVFRSHTINAYLYANREVAHQVSAIAAVHHTSSDQKAPPNPCIALPEGASVKPKFHSVLLPGTTVGDKVTFKSSVVGRNCQLGAKCRLNNVVLQDNVTLGDNIILQNTVVGHHATLAENCNLNDCQVAPGMSLPAGTKQKGEAFVNDDNDGQDEIADPVL